MSVAMEALTRMRRPASRRRSPPSPLGLSTRMAELIVMSLLAWRVMLVPSERDAVSEAAEMARLSPGPAAKVTREVKS